MTTYSDVSLMIDGAWSKGAGGRTIPIINPATEEVIGQVAHAERSDLDRALAAADKGFKQWRKVSAYERYKIMRKAADLMRQRLDDIAAIMTMEQGKPLVEAKVETNLAADIIDWMAEEGRRTYGRIVPARAACQGLRRCRRAGGSHPAGLWRAVGDQRVPDPPSHHQEGDLHRLHAGRQAARRTCRRAHEARHHGAR